MNWPTIWLMTVASLPVEAVPVSPVIGKSELEDLGGPVIAWIERAQLTS